MVDILFKSHCIKSGKPGMVDIIIYYYICYQYGEGPVNMPDFAPVGPI